MFGIDRDVEGSALYWKSGIEINFMNVSILNLNLDIKSICIDV